MSLTERSEIPVIGINYRDELSLAAGWLEENGNPFQFSVVDRDGRFGIDLGVYGAPETYLVDAEGIIRYRHVSVLDDSVWREVFVPLINNLRSPRIGLVEL
jgi:cytochrome c biogenesis protein CcmG/thiol:disulfide interchange protein DsbE